MAGSKGVVPSRWLTLTWGKAGVFFVLGVWPGVLIAYNLRPVYRLAEQTHRYQQELHFEGAYDRFRAAAGPAIEQIGAVRDATRGLNSGTGGEPYFARLRSLDLNNGVPIYLAAAAKLPDTISADDAEARFARVREDLEAAGRTPRFEWYARRAAELWRQALSESGARKDLNARIARDWAVDGQAAAIRTACSRLASLVDALMWAGRSEEAEECNLAAIDLARRTLDGTISGDVAAACAEQLHGAYRQAATIRAAGGRWDAAARARDRADRATQFLRVLRERRLAAPFDPMLQISTPRAEPYRATLNYLLASGSLVAGWTVLLVTAVVMLILTVVARVAGSRGKSQEAVTIGPRVVSWLWAAGIVAGPSAVIAAAVLLVPTDAGRTTSMSWITAMLMLCLVLTAGSVLTLGRARASAGGDVPRTSRVWQAWWLLLALVVLVVLLRPFSPFGGDQAAFDQGLRSPQAAAGASRLAGAAASLALAGLVVWGVWVAGAWLRTEKRPYNGRQDRSRGRFPRTVLALAMWGWLILGIMSMGAVRVYHRYDARLQELTIQDLQDEVPAWLGPSWKRAFFPAP